MTKTRRRGAGEGSVFQRADGVWVASLSVGWGRTGRSRKVRYAPTQAEAIHKLDELKEQVGAGLPVADPRVTVGKFLVGWLKGVESRLRPATFRRYQGLVEQQLIPTLGHLRLAKLTPADVGKMVAEVQEAGLSPRTAAHCRAVLRAALADGEKWGDVHRNVAKLSDPPRVPAPSPVVLSAPVTQAVIEAMGNGQLRRLVVVALFTGLRLGEELGLTWDDVDLSTGILNVRHTLQRLGGEFTQGEPKSASSRRAVVLPPQAVAALEEERAVQREAGSSVRPQGRRAYGDLVFTDPEGAPLVATTTTHQLQRRLAEAGLPRLRWHDLRAAHGALLLASGTDISVVSKRLGHSSVALTSRHYGGVAEALQREASDRLGRLLERQV